MPPPDGARYRLEPPAAGAGVEAWQAAVDNATAQLGHQGLRIQNLELLGRYGPAAWQAHVRSLETALGRAKRELKELDDQVTAVNQTRAVRQRAVGAELARMEAEWRAEVAKCAEIEAACEAMERQLEAARGNGHAGDAHAAEAQGDGEGQAAAAQNGGGEESATAAVDAVAG